MKILTVYSMKIPISCALLAMFLLIIPIISEANALEKILNNLNTLQVSFIQTEEINNQSTQISYGSLTLKVPGKFAWLNEEPTQQDVFANGQKIWIYEKDLAQVSVYNQADILLNTPAILISEPSKFKQNFTIDQILEDSKGTLYSLSPKQNNSYYDYIEVTIRENTITKLTILNRLNNALTHIEFYYTEDSLNHQINDSIFEFKIPDGVDVLY